MDADWYEDPLERYHGRFFDGERWTERVSADGVLAVDPDFPSINEAAELDKSAPESGEFELVDEPAVAAVPKRQPLRASLIEESPVRTVAVLDQNTVADSSGGSSESSRPGNSADRSFLVWGLLGLVGVLAIVGVLIWQSGDDGSSAVAEAVDLDEQQEERVQDLAEGGVETDADAAVIEELDVDAPVGTVELDAVFDSDEAVEVGSLRVVNGATVLRDLEEWHREFAAERGVELGPDSGCWFGQLGGAAVQVAQCGPVGGSADSEFLFDQVPLVFEDTDGGQIAQPVVDAATIDTLLPNALTLVGSDESSAPPLSLEGATSED